MVDSHYLNYIILVNYNVLYHRSVHFYLMLTVPITLKAIFQNGEVYPFLLDAFTPKCEESSKNLFLYKEQYEEMAVCKFNGTTCTICNKFVHSKFIKCGIKKGVGFNPSIIMLNVSIGLEIIPLFPLDAFLLHLPTPSLYS